MGPMVAHGGKAPVLPSSNEKRGPTEIKRDIETLQEQLNVEKRVAVVEQRVSVLVQGLFCESKSRARIFHVSRADPYRMAGIVMMTGPFETLIGFIPKGVIAGLFWWVQYRPYRRRLAIRSIIGETYNRYMGTSALFSSGVTEHFLYLIRDGHLTSPAHPLHGVRKSRLLIWLWFELIGFAATFAITNTIASIGEHSRFPPCLILPCLFVMFTTDFSVQASPS